jgi:hypothetical protein
VQLDRRKPGREGAQHAARLDGRELMRVADHDELPARRVDACEEFGERTSAEHAGLVDHEDGAGLKGPGAA